MRQIRPPGVEFWEAADYFRAKGVKATVEGMLSFGRSGRFTACGCRWSIMLHITAGLDNGDQSIGSRINIGQEYLTTKRDAKLADPFADENRFVKLVEEALRELGYEGAFEDDMLGPFRKTDALEFRRFNARFDRDIATLEDLAVEYERLAAPDLAVAFGLPDLGTRKGP